MPETVEVCRLCLSNKNLMFPIFQNRICKSETPFRTKIMTCASIEVFADDDLPAKVCYICIHQVEKFFQFQAMCANSDSILRSQSKQTKVLHEIEDSEKNVCLLEDSVAEKEKSNTLPNHHSTNCNEKNFNVDSLTCNICASIFLTSNLLIDHLIKSHSDKDLFFCRICKIAFSHVSKFKNHLNLQHSLSCKYCDCVFQFEKSLKDHLKIHAGENFNCKFCGKSFLDFNDMRKHEISHSEKTCSYCTKELNSKNEFDLHFKECDQKYYCKFCKEAFDFKKELIKHVNNYHSSCTYEKCDNCQNTLVADQVQEHKCENENQSLKCTNCQIQCVDNLSLMDNMSTEHSKDMLTCKFCAKKFGLRSSLKRHERSHSGIKPYQCKFCPRKFKDSSACVVHTRTHTGERPFRCQECHKDFKQLANLKMHTYRHHKKNKKSPELKSEILSESRNDYEQLYTGDIIGSYSGDNIRSYQDLNESISDSFNQSLSILMPDHNSN